MTSMPSPRTSPRRATLVLLGSVSAALVAGALPATAAELPACPAKGKPATTTTCVISWDGRVFSPAETKVRAGVPIKFSNFGDAIVDGDLTVSWISGGKTVEVEVERGEASDPVVLSGSGTVTITGDDNSAREGEGKITLVQAPQSSTPPTNEPTVKPTTNTKKPQSDDNTKDGKAKATPKPRQSAAAAGQGVTNPPPLGIPEVSPGATPSPGLPPVVAPGVTPTPAPTATLTTPTDVPTTLAQPVAARRVGLPGALAGVLLVGVVAGVYRLARVEYGVPPHLGTVPSPDEPDEAA